MGFLHAGHVSLLEAARERCDVVVMSLFVNPAQFAPGEDLASYPRDEARDLALAAEAGVDIVYAPGVEEVYPDGLRDHGRGHRAHRRALRRSRTAAAPSTSAASRPSSRSCSTASTRTSRSSARRTPSRRSSIRRMARDLDFRAEIVVMPTIREPDGLAMSSRNAYLSDEERERATALNRALHGARAVAESGEPSVAAALEAAREVLASAGIEPEYLEARDAESLEPGRDLQRATGAGRCRRAARQGAADRQRGDRGRAERPAR